jgi:hypothetical protein
MVAKTGGSLIVVATERGDRIWVIFFNEAAHIPLHGKRQLFLNGGPGEGA